MSFEILSIWANKRKFQPPLHVAQCQKLPNEPQRSFTLWGKWAGNSQFLQIKKQHVVFLCLPLLWFHLTLCFLLLLMFKEAAEGRSSKTMLCSKITLQLLHEYKLNYIALHIWMESFHNSIQSKWDNYLISLCVSSPHWVFSCYLVTCRRQGQQTLKKM